MRFLLLLGVFSALLLDICLSLGLDIYPYVIQSLRELKDRERAEKNPIVQYATSVCYEYVGCFHRNGTFKHLKQLPDTPENIGTQFYLYTPDHPNDEDCQLLDYTDSQSILDSSLNPKKPLKFITHGFGGRKHGEWLWGMKDAFIKEEGANVVIVDWSNGAAPPHYINSAVNAELVGAQIAVMYYLIKDTIGIQEKDLHVIGFSLGGQVMGFVGKRMLMMRGTRPARITGLDPAGPLYEDYGEDVHVYKDDADFVDIIHTNADLLIYGGVGIGKAIGDVDFYPNGGIRQPGCNSTIKGFFIDIITNSNDRQRVCNHERSISLFVETIPSSSSCHYHSYKCEDFKIFQTGQCFQCKGDDCGIMGYRAKGSGSHYLQTHAKSPYCAQTMLLSVHYAKDTKKSYGALRLHLIGQSGIEQEVNITREKDERLLPSGSRVFTQVLNPELGAIKGAKMTYIRYNGWIAKGTPTFTIDAVSIVDVRMKSLFASCESRELEDEIPTRLKSTKNTC